MITINKSLSKETFARYRSMQYGVNRRGGAGGPARIFVKNT